MKERTVKIYNCDYCKKLYQIKNACLKHESKCRKNPKNYRPCFDCCQYLEKKKFTICVDNEYYTNERALNLFYCKKKELAVCPYWYNEPYELDETENIHMPKECEFHK